MLAYCRSVPWEELSYLEFIPTAQAGSDMFCIDFQDIQLCQTAECLLPQIGELL